MTAMNKPHVMILLEVSRVLVMRDTLAMVAIAPVCFLCCNEQLHSVDGVCISVDACEKQESTFPQICRQAAKL